MGVFIFGGGDSLGLNCFNLKRANYPAFSLPIGKIISFDSTIF